MNDSQALHSGKRHEVHNHVAPGLFIYLGLELEDLQCVFLLAVYWPLADKFSGVDLPWMQLNWVPMQQVFSEQRFLSDQIRSGVALMHGLRFNTSTYLRWLRFACPLTKKVAESHWEPMRSNFIFRLRSTPPSIVTFSCSSMNGICGMHRPIAPSMIFADFYLWNQWCSNRSGDILEDSGSKRGVSIFSNAWDQESMLQLPSITIYGRRYSRWLDHCSSSIGKMFWRCWRMATWLHWHL